MLKPNHHLPSLALVVAAPVTVQTYLTTAFTRVFGSQAHVEHTSTFNSAGFAPGSETVFTELQNLIGPSYGLGCFPNASEQTNYFAQNGLNLTTNNSWFTQTGTPAEYISKNFSVVTQIESGLSSFDATVWRANNADGTANPTSKLYVSMRGTQQLSELLVDTDLAVTANSCVHAANETNFRRAA